MLNRFLDPILLKVLTEEANKIAISAKENANWSSKIPDAINVGVATTDGRGTYQIDVIVNTNPESGAPMAPAFEYGSGMHDPNEPHLIPIPQVKPGPLIFWWENRQKWFFGLKLPYGHPGVAPRPFLKPAVEENRPSIIARIVNVFKRGFLDSIAIEFKDVSIK